MSPDKLKSFEKTALEAAIAKVDQGREAELTEYEVGLLNKYDRVTHNEHLMREEIFERIR